MGGYVGYVGYVGITIGAGVDVAIGVVEAAGTGRTTRIPLEMLAETFRTGTLTASGFTSPPGPSEGDAKELVEPSGGKSTRCSTSFALAWLVSGRGHLPRLVLDSNDGRADDSKVNSAG